MKIQKRTGYEKMIESVSFFAAKLVGSSLSSLMGTIKDESLRLVLEKNVSNILKYLKDRSKHEKIEQNNDLYRATIKSFYKAVELISTECLQESTQINWEYTDDIRVLKDAIDDFKKENARRLKMMEHNDKPDGFISLYIEQFSLLLATNEEVAKEQIDDLESVLIKTALRFEIPSEVYPILVTKKIYDYTKKFFMNEIKENQKVRDIFLSYQVVDISIKTDEIVNQTELILAVINDYIGTTISTNQKIDEMYEILLQLKLRFERPDNYNDLQKVQFRINNAKHIENFSKFFGVTHSVVITILQMQEHIDYFLDRYNKYPLDTVNEKAIYDSEYSEKMIEINKNRDIRARLALIYSNPYVQYRIRMRDNLVSEVYRERFQAMSQSFIDLLKLHTIEIKHAFAIPPIEELIKTKEKFEKIVILIKTSGSAYSNLFYSFEGVSASAGIFAFEDHSINAIRQLGMDLNEIGAELKNYIEKMNKAFC